MSMVVWISIMTVIFGVLAVQNLAGERPKAALTAVFMWTLYAALWFLFVFRGVVM